MAIQTPPQQNKKLGTQSQPTSLRDNNPGDKLLEQKVLIFLWCLWFSIAIIILFIGFFILTYLFPGGHPPDDPYDQYMTWTARAQFILAFILVPAMYGSFAWVPIKHLRNGKKIKSTFFISLIMVGSVSAFIGYFGTGLSHLDCGNNCGADVPSYHLMLGAFLVATAVTVIVPIFAIVKLVKLNRNSTTESKVAKPQ